MRRSVHYSQNFLRPGPQLEQLVINSSLVADDTVVDIGAGSGTLTALLARRCYRVIAIEADPRLASRLRVRFADALNVAVHQEDFLTMPLPRSGYKVFANIPFNKTSDIIHKLLDSENPPQDCYLIIQREAAEKFAGRPGRHSLFSTLHMPQFEMSIVHRLQPADFRPQPKVAVVILRCRLRTEPLISSSDQRLYANFVSYIFNHANPTVLPALQQLFSPPQLAALAAQTSSSLAIKPTQLPPAAWFGLFRAFHQSATHAQRRFVQGAAARLRLEASSVEKYHRTRLSKDWRREAASEQHRLARG